MQIIRPNTKIDFVGKNRMAVVLSLVVILAGIVSLVVKGGPAYGVDFAGGTLIQVQFTQPTEAADIRAALENAQLGAFVVQQFGDGANEFLIRAPEIGADLEQLSKRIKESLESKFGAGKLEIRRTEVVGAQVGKDLREKGFWAIIYSLIGTLLYVAWRFEFRSAIAAIVALVHDVLVTLGFFSLFDKEIDLTIIAAFLTIVGFSLNDTIVIFDRIRETGHNPHESYAATVNRCLNETLSRTILTSGTVLLVVLALFFFGGTVIHNFAFAMLVGVISGVYSTVFVAGALVIYWERLSPRKLVKVAKATK